MVDFSHVPGDEDEDGGEDGKRNKLGVRRQQEHEDQERKGVDDAGEWGFAAGLHVGGGAGDGAGGRDAQKKNRTDISDTLGDEFAIGFMAATDHAIGDDVAENGGIRVDHVNFSLFHRADAHGADVKAEPYT